VARTVITLNNPILKLADDQAGLAASTDVFECQLTSAMITASPVFNTIPATGCAPASQSPGRTGYSLDLAWLQDWTAAGGGLSGYAFANDGLPKWFSFTLDSVGAPTVVATGQVYVVAGGFGGTFGDGSAAATTATWPCVDTPDITPAAVAAAV
jgi:hypothetical protein